MFILHFFYKTSTSTETWHMLYKIYHYEVCTGTSTTTEPGTVPGTRTYKYSTW